MSKVDWASEERKLGPVYDDIQCKRYKVADGQVTKWLKKHPKSQPALVLRMVLLQKLGSGSEAVLSAYEEVKKTGNLTGRSVWWIVLALRGISRLDLILDLYQKLWDDIPSSEELGSQVYLNAASIGNTEVMMQSSRKMFNLTKTSVWARSAAYSNWIHNSSSPTIANPFPPPCPPRSLIVAQTLLRTSRRPTTADHLWLHVQILLSSGQVAETLTLLRREAGYGALARTWIRMRTVEIIAERMDGVEDVKALWEGEWDWVAGLFAKADGQELKNYAFYQHLLLATRNLVQYSPDVVHRTRELLRKLHDSIGEKERAPKLAILELDLWTRRAGREDLAMTQDGWTSETRSYWVKWGCKGSCVTEIEGIIGDAEGRMKILRGILEETMERGHSDLNSYLEILHAERIILRQRDMSWQPTLTDVSRLWTLYQDGLQYGRNLPKTDVQPADEFGYASVQLLLTIWHNDKSDESKLFQAIVYLEYMVLNSPSAAHARFLLIRLYRLLGAPSLLETHLKSLKPGEIQLDNLLHVFFERGAGEAVMGGSRQVWESHYDLASKMYHRTAADLPEYIKSALETENYSKVHGIQELQHSIARSLSGQVALIESARKSLFLSQPLPGDMLERISISLLDRSPFCDIRNFELIPEIGGRRVDSRSISDLPARSINEGWVRCMSRFIVLVGKFKNGERVSDDEMSNASHEDLSPPEQALVSLSSAILHRAIGVITGIQSDEAIDVPNLDDLISHCHPSENSSRYEILQAHILVIEFSRIVDIVTTRLREFTQAPKKSKKTPPHVNDVMKEVKAIREDLEKRMKSLASEIDDRLGAEEWATDGLPVDINFAEEVRARVRGSRQTLMDNLKIALEGRKI